MRLPLKEILVSELRYLLVECCGQFSCEPDFADRLRAVLEPWRSEIENQKWQGKSISIDQIVTQLVESNKEKEKPKDRVGQRVRCWNGDKSKYLGEGVYVGDATVYMIVNPNNPYMIQTAANPESPPPADQVPYGKKVVKSDGNPKIELDSGRVVYGCQVWWEPI